MLKTFAVIGDPIDHSLSPIIHNAAFRELGLDCTYIGYRIPKGELEEGIISLKKINISGFNVTIPHKVEVMKYLDSVDETASLIGAANTVTNENGKLKGYNTDMDGFLEPIKMRNLSIKDSNVLVLGSGGAARAVVAALVKEKANSITIANRTISNTKDIERFSDRIGLKPEVISLDEIDKMKKDYNYIVNCTSLGLKNESSPIPKGNFKKGMVVYDVVYRPMNTDLISKAKEAGSTVIYGYEMLLGQAARSFKIWHNIEAPYNAMKKALLGGF